MSTEAARGELFVAPLEVHGPEECTFYHTLELPGFGLQRGSWDLRAGIDSYLSSTDFRHRRVLDVGASDGYLAVELEKRGAEVIALDLPEDAVGDRVPGEPAAVAHLAPLPSDRRHRVHKAFWLVQRQSGATAKRVHGHVGRLPAALGAVDYVFIGNVLQHLQDPLQALASAAAVASDGIIVTEANWNTALDQDAPLMYLMTPQKIAEGSPFWFRCWWQLTPGLVAAWLSILGFDLVERTVHRQLFEDTGTQVPHFTIVARRRR